jgi:hypothetical protein
LSSSAVAHTPPPPAENSVKSRHIVNGQVKPVDQGPVPGAKLQHSVNQTIPDNVDTAVVFDTELRDTGNLHNSTNPSRLTASKAGVYLISANIAWTDADVDGARTIKILKNGGTPDLAREITVPSAGGRNRYQAIATQEALGKGDYVEVFVQQNSGSPGTVFANSVSGAPHFEMTWIAPHP